MHMKDQNIEQVSNNNECHNDKYETFFDVVGVSRNESAHSNFLRWFFDQPEWNGKYLLQLFKICKDNANDQGIQIPDGSEILIWIKMTIISLKFIILNSKRPAMSYINLSLNGEK